MTIGTWGNEQFTLDNGGVGTAVGNAFRLSVRDASTTTYNAVSSVVADGNWHHLVGVCDEANSNLFIYVDGVRAGSATIPSGKGLLARTAPLMIGQRGGPSGTPSEQFRGTVDEVALYNIPLTSSQIMNHYSLGKTGIPFNSNPTNIVFSNSGSDLTLSWPMDHTGWQLQSNSVGLGATGAWFTVAGSMATNQIIITPGVSQTNVFYRMLLQQ